ncbi:MAG: hypothetical protein AVO39_00610 [delta proteobacterium MLS_D]|jgi:medium-chain acyl-[acyl-carrier-protein] hydrolase|nr:MAG: hypothetical protein AVO39_00610 [delta proteobacterium MLS_D]
MVKNTIAAPDTADEHVSSDTSKALFTANYAVRYSETGADGRLKPGAIFNYLQDAAGDHAALLGVSSGDLIQSGLGWVLHQYSLHIDRYPSLNENIEVRTWRQTHRRLYELREFDVRNGSGRKIAHAKSSWILIHLGSRRPLRLDRNLPALACGCEKDITWTFRPPEVPTRIDREALLPVRRHDLDVNRHANNAVFVQWAIDTVPRETADGCSPREIDVLFQAEALEDDFIRSQVCRIDDSDDQNVYLHRILHAETGRELSRLRSSWR